VFGYCVTTGNAVKTSSATSAFNAFGSSPMMIPDAEIKQVSNKIQVVMMMM